MCVQFSCFCIFALRRYREEENGSKNIPPARAGVAEAQRPPRLAETWVKSRALCLQTSHRRPESSASASSTPSMSVRSPTSQSPPDGEHKVNDPTQMLQQDWREFECRTWHLEPTVRSVASDTSFDTAGLFNSCQEAGVGKLLQSV